MFGAFGRGFSQDYGGGAKIDGPVSVVTQPFREAADILAGVVGGTREALSSTGRLGRDVAAMPEAFAGSLGASQMPIKGVPGQVLSPAREAIMQGRSSKPTPQAQHLVNQTFRQGESEVTALDAIDKISKARQEGQPLTLSDVGGRPIRRLAGTIYRSGGEPAAYMEKFYKGRSTDLTLDHLNTAAGTRIEKAIGENIATGSYKQATKDLIAQRSERARPLWEEATAGGSLAPLETQFANAFNKASATEKAAGKALADAQNEATQAAGRQSTAGNVYAASGANRGAGDAAQKIKLATKALSEARQAADETRNRLRRAQDDGTANAPGAVWSPRLQEFLNLPDWQEGVRRGLKMERRDAVTEARPFNPTEYAIVGEENGEPVVGAVPTMKLLQVAKEGMAAKVDDERDKLTGALSKAGRSLWLNLKAFEQEGYNLNPAWKTANDAWSGDSDSIRALQLGKKIFTIPMEDLAADFGAMSKADKELFKLSAASKAVEDVRKTPLSADPSKRVINTPDELRRLRLLFDSDAEFQRFAQTIDTERTMFETGTDVMRGSQTAERHAADAAGSGMDLVHGLGHAIMGNVRGAALPLIRASKGLGIRNNEKLNMEVAKILTNPDLTLADTPGGLLSGAGGMLRDIPR
jgi:hypothetical protein